MSLSVGLRYALKEYAHKNPPIAAPSPQSHPPLPPSLLSNKPPPFIRRRVRTPQRNRNLLAHVRPRRVRKGSTNLRKLGESAQAHRISRISRHFIRPENVDLSREARHDGV